MTQDIEAAATDRLDPRVGIVNTGDPFAALQGQHLSGADAAGQQAWLGLRKIVCMHVSAPSFHSPVGQTGIQALLRSAPM